MTKPMLALLLSLLATAAFAAAQDAATAGAEPDPATATAEPQPAPAAQSADQAALEAAPYDGPHGKSRVERRREKCRALAEQQQLTGDALDRHMQDCVKR